MRIADCELRQGSLGESFIFLAESLRLRCLWNLPQYFGFPQMNRLYAKLILYSQTSQDQLFMQSASMTNEPQMRGIRAFLSSDTLLAALVTLMTIFTAVTVYQASLAGGDSLTNFFNAQAYVTDASLAYLESGQDLFYDHSVYDQYQLALMRNDEETAKCFLAKFSVPALAGLERAPDDPFDKEYENAQYAAAKGLVQTADEYYDLAVKLNKKGDNLTLVTTILAIGLAFAAWGSLAERGSRQRIMFAFFGIIALGLSVFEYLRIMAAG
jgi:hypothetical protein